jgi:hypothetical protein
MQSLPGSGQLSRQEFGVLFVNAWTFQHLAYGRVIGISIRYYSRSSRPKVPGEFPKNNSRYLPRLKG